MTQPREVIAYAPEFLELAERMQADPAGTILVPCPTIKDAQRLRFRLYGFQQAMKREGLDQPFPLFAVAEIRLKTGDQPGLEIEARDRCQDASILRAALHPEKKE